MEPSGGGRIAAKRTRRARPPPSGAGEDRLSALPDDILVLILLRLDAPYGSYAAGRTSVLSRRWRRVWALLPDLNFPFPVEPHHVATALAARGAAALRDLRVVTADAESVALWLAAAAARRISGRLDISNISQERGAAAATAVGEGDPNNPAGEAAGPVDRGTFELPCLGDATAVSLNLGYLGLYVPPAGVFARLTELSLISVRFESRCDVGDAVSSPRCPSLEKLTIRNAIGMVDLAIHSESLLQLVLHCFVGLQQLTIVAPALLDLNTSSCFPLSSRPVADISTPKLVKLEWKDAYDPRTVQFDNMGQLQSLSADFFHVYGQQDSEDNRNVMKFLQRFQAVNNLEVSLLYRQVISKFQYLMDDITRLPHATFLTLFLASRGHAFGAGSFHILKLCSGIRKLRLVLFDSSRDLKEQSECPSGCICDQLTDWKTEELLLNSLEVVVIFNLKGADHEVDFVKCLLNWATNLKMMTITFDYAVSGSRAAEVCRSLSSLARAETCMKFYRDRSTENKSCYLFAKQLAKAGDSLRTGHLHFAEMV
ncbi:unnamed protein product [Urochloa humidicola]